MKNYPSRPVSSIFATEKYFKIFPKKSGYANSSEPVALS